MTLRIRRLFILGIVLATIGCDRATKQLAVDHLAGRSGQRYLADTVRLQYVENRGAFLGLGASLPGWARTTLFVVGTGLLLAGMVALGLRHRVTGPCLVGLALLWSGGVSNLVDRVVHGSVVDFLNVGMGPLRTGVFNMADVAIMAGCALVLATRAVGAGRAKP
jgi:signal peptidase II